MKWVMLPCPPLENPISQYPTATGPIRVTEHLVFVFSKTYRNKQREVCTSGSPGSRPMLSHCDVSRQVHIPEINTRGNKCRKEARYRGELRPFCFV